MHFRRGSMCPCSHFAIFPTKSFHDFAYMLHWLYAPPFSFFDIPHHISSRPCTHFTMDSRCPHVIFLMFLVASLLVLFMWVFLLFLQSAFFPKQQKSTLSFTIAGVLPGAEPVFFQLKLQSLPHLFSCVQIKP